MLQRAREAYAQINGRAAPLYGLAASVAMAVPLLVGTLTGYAAAGSTIALGAYLVALRAPEGPYGSQARDLAGGVLMVTVGAAVGGLLSGHTWLAVAVVPPLVALGTAVSQIGSTAGMAVLNSAIRPPTSDVVHSGLLEMIGGLFTTALLLAPWPARRLKPLRAALSEAADAVAEALDAVAQDVGAPDGSVLDKVELDDPELEEVTRKPDWEQRRRAASEALTDARTTYSLYRSGRGRDDPTRPERFIEALARIMHEAVTLEAVVEATRNSPPDREWELDTHIAISALAARLRLLSGAVATAGDAPLGGEESAAVRRVVRQTEAIRRAGLAGDEDLVAVALIGQIRRSIDRISGEMNTARRLIAGGLRLKVGAPRLPDPHPKSASARIGRAVRNRTPKFRQVARVLVTAVVSMALAAAFAIPHGQWMTITAMLSLRDTYGETVDRLVQRVGGTAAGSAVAALLLALAPGHLTIILVIFVFGLGAFALRSVNFTYWALFGSPLFLMLLSFSTPSGWATAGERIGLTIAGTVIAFLAVRLLWPTGHVERLPVQLGRMLGVHAELVRAAAAVVDGELPSLPHEKVIAAEEGALSVARTRDRLELERVPDTELIDALLTAVRAAHRVRDRLIAVARMAREEAVDTGPLPEILDRLADQLEEAAEGIEDPEEIPRGGPSPMEELEEELAALDAHLTRLTKRRRAEIKSGVDREEYTPLRRALLQASGIRHTVGSLRRDVATVIGSCVNAVAPDLGPADSAARPETEPAEPEPTGITPDDSELARDPESTPKNDPGQEKGSG